MKNQRTNFLLLILACFLLIFTGCENEDDYSNLHEHEGNNPNVVSLDFFQDKTNINNLEKFLRSKNELTKNADSINFDDFYINTEHIYQCVLEDGDVSFSFDIEPIQECLPIEEFNLVIKKDDNDNWFSRIFKLTSNTDGSSQNKFSSIQEIYSANGLPNEINKSFEYIWVETTEVNCTYQNTAACANGCDLCSLCTTTTITIVPVFVPGTDSGSSTPDFNYNDGVDTNGGGGSSGIPNQVERNELISYLDLQPGSQQHSYISGSASLDVMNVLIDYLNENSIMSSFGNPDFTQESKTFVNELIMLLRWDGFNNSQTNLSVLNLMIETQNQDKFYSAVDDQFISSINQYIDLDTNSCCGPFFRLLFQQYANAKTASLKYQHDWSFSKIMWEVYGEIVHLSLDGLGLVPFFGEPADIVNGAIYAIEGDMLNAGLSVASAVPFVGWLSTGGKIIIKVKKVISSGVVGLIWDVGTDGIVHFGNRNILKRIIESNQLTDAFGNILHAHHIVPYNFWNHPIVQKAANSDGGFNINEALNGIPLPSTNHLTGHNSIGGYNDTVGEILNEIDELAIDNNNAYNKLVDFIQYLDNLITSNSDLNMGEIADLIDYIPQ